MQSPTGDWNGPGLNVEQMPSRAGEAIRNNEVAGNRGARAALAMQPHLGSIVGSRYTAQEATKSGEQKSATTRTAKFS